MVEKFASPQASVKTSLPRSASTRPKPFLTVSRLLYERIVRPLLFWETAQAAHLRAMSLLRWLDGQGWALTLLRGINTIAFDERPVEVGGVRLPHPLILAAGFVKGDGFADDDEPGALQAAAGRNIIPGWRSMPLLVGAVEFGSFTRHPRPGNPGVVLWRDEPTRSTQNRIGLKNPGAHAAAEFLALHRNQLPSVFGINIAPSPGLSDPEQECREVLEALAAFLDRGVRPAWFTLNLSCPNTEDDPGSHQTEARARSLCATVVDALGLIPLWVKVSPDLAIEQYHALLRAFADTGVRAIVATNTLGAPAPGDPAGHTMAGIGGGRLREKALEAVGILCSEIERQQMNIDVIACGGIEDGQTYHDFSALGARAAQYQSALIYRGPLAAALIEQESAP